jgi:hypothetical protein
MDRELWAFVTHSVDRALLGFPAIGRARRFSDRLIVLMLIWAVWHDRCLSWACDRRHYGDLFRPRAVPSISWFARRVKTERAREVLQWVNDDLAIRGTSCPHDLLSYVDAKALLVSPVSKDPDARRGKITGAFAKGYKFHATVNQNRRVVVWCVTPLNTDEKTMATQMLNHLPPGQPATAAGIALAAPLTLGDSNYDSAPLHRAFAAHDRYLLTPLRGEQFVGPNGRHPRTLTAMGPRRREVLAISESSPELVRYVLKSRNNIEGTFSVLSLACGLDRLPGFVRRLPRVTRWVGCKVILYHARLLAQEAKKKAAA